MRRIFLLPLLMVACGGGGAELGDLTALPQRASVVIRMTQESSEDVGGVYVTFSKVSLVPKDGGDPVVLFESTIGEEVNFSNLDNEALLFAVNDDVPAGTYTKLLVAVDSIRVVGGPCEDLVTSVPDDEIELLPDAEIEIKADDKLSITLAMNSDQSVQIKVDGENEICVFQPVVKVDVGLLSPPEAQDCPTSVTGEVTDIVLSIHNDVLGFVLDLGEGSDDQTVLVSDDTGMFGTDGLPTSPDIIDLGDELTAKGRLDENGDMLADVIIAGDVITFSGTVLSMPERGIVRVLPDEGEAVVGETNVRLFADTLILFNCQDATAASLTKGAKVTVAGKVAADKRVFYAAEVEVDPVVIVGDLLSCIEVKDGFEIAVLPVGVAIKQTIFVPEDVGIQLQGDGTIPKSLLQDLLDCEPLPVRVTLSGDEGDGLEPSPKLAAAVDGELVASEVRVGAESVKGKVTDIDAELRMVTVDRTVIAVLRTATIIDLRDGESLGSLADINVGDCLRVFGLEACEDDTEVDFHGFVLLILEDEKPEPPHPDRYEGCGQGFWKNHASAWPTAYSPDDLFDDIFEETFPRQTLMDVLNQGGGGVRALGRKTVAALLNAASDRVHYRFTEREVIGKFNEASPDGRVEWLKKLFEYNNELGCPWDGEDDDRDDDDDRGKKDERDDD